MEEIVPGFSLKKAEVEKEDGVLVFEIKGSGDGKKFEMKVTEDGGVLESEIEDEEDDDSEDDMVELPQAVADAIAAEFPDLVIRESELEDGVYEVEGTENGKEIEIKVRPDGTVVNIEIDGQEVGDDGDEGDDSNDEGSGDDDSEDDMVELPQAVADAIAAEFPDLVIRESELEDGVYEVEGTENGKEIEIKVRPDGTVLKIEIDGQEVGDGNDGEDDTSGSNDGSGSGDGEDPTDEGDNDSNDDSESPPAGDPSLPEAVIKALDELAPGLRITELESEFKNDRILYKIHGYVNGAEAEIKIFGDGTVVKSEIQDEEERNDTHINPDSVPQAVFDTLETTVPGLTVREIEFNGRYYEVEGTVEGKEVELKILADGTLLKFEVEGDDDDGEKERHDHLTVDDLPEAVRTALSGAAPDIEISEIELESSDGGEIYEIEGTENGKRVELKIAADGTILKFEMDSDGDGLGDADESDVGSDPDDPDSDDDAFPDGFESENGADPLDPNAQPQILNVSLMRDAVPAKVKLEILTFDGKEFDLEHCPDGIHWEDLGVTILGDGAVHHVTIPVDGFEACGFFRVNLKELGERSSPTGSGQSPGDGEKPSTEGKKCEMPDTLEGIVIDLGDYDDDEDDDHHHIMFDKGGTGREIETDGHEIEFTPFTYTVKEKSDCVMEVTVTFPGESEDHVIIYEIQFCEEGKGILTRKNPDDGGLVHRSFTYHQDSDEPEDADQV